MKTSFLIFIVSIAFCLDACTTSEHGRAVSTSSSTDETAPLPGLPEVQRGPGPNECPPADAPCPEIYAPSYCRARAYQDEPLMEDQTIRAWGENSCVAKLALAGEACRSGKSPAAMSGVECIPDVSRGKCPFQRKICTMDVSPKVCTAMRYAGQVIEPGEGGATQLVATGSNECDAKNNLMQLACIKNLDPDKVGGITCKIPKSN